MGELRIGGLAKETKVNIQTIRYYERRGLLPIPVRREGGYRQYTVNDIRRIRFIKNSQKLGFSLNEISELLSLRVESDDSCMKVLKKAEVKITEIEEKIQTLRQMKKALSSLAETCRKNEKTGECPIIESLDTEYSR